MKNHRFISLALILLFQGKLIGAGTEITKHLIDSVNTISYEYIVSNVRISIDMFLNNASAARSFNYKFGEAKALENLHTAYWIDGKPDASADCGVKALRLYEEVGALPELANLYGRYGLKIRKLDINKARQYMLLGIKLAEDNEFKQHLRSLYDDFGVLHEQENNFDSAMIYYKKALNVKMELQDSIGIPYSLNNIAGIHAMKSEFKEALKYAAMSDEYRSKEEGEFGRALNLVLYGEIYNAMGRIDKAVDHFDRCLQMSHNLGYKDLVCYSYLKLTEMYEQKSDYKKALNHHQKFTAYKDSLLNVTTNARIAELEIAYETEKKDLQLAENELTMRRRRTQILILISITGLLLTISIAFYRFQQLKRRRLRKEMELQNQLEQFELEKRLADEKLRISRELHDNIGSHLTFMISSLDNLSYGSREGKVRSKLEHLSSFGRSTMSELRNSIWAMKQDDGGLSSLILKLNQLKQHVHHEMENLKIEINNNINRAVKLNSTQMLNLYRIVQEALQNTIKYAEAERFIVDFKSSAECFLLRISDNGRGFDMNKAGKGNGLINMKQRCQEAGGVYNITSTEAGTVITCEVHC